MIKEEINYYFNKDMIDDYVCPSKELSYRSKYRICPCCSKHKIKGKIYSNN